MRILNICAYTWEIGGPARIIYDHTTQALNKGHQVTIASPMTPGDKLYEVPPGAVLLPFRRTAPLSNLYREFSVELYSYLKKHMREFDIIHIHGIWHFGSLAPFLISSKVPKVITIHGLLDRWAFGHHQWKKDLVTLLYQKRLLAKADLIHINNTDEREDIIRYLGYEPKNLVMIPNGMEMSEYTELPPKIIFRNQYNVPLSQKMVLFMGRLNIKKGLDLLLPAFANYHRMHQDAQLILAGPDDGYQEEIEKYITDHELANHIKLVGMLTDQVKKAALADADLFVLPSYSEGFSIAVLEAMASQVPTLVSDRVGFGDAIEQYRAAYVSPLTVDGLTQGLLQTLQNEAERTTYAQNAYKMLKENFEIGNVAQKMLNAYVRLLNR
jgi:glycosyltransferase involved in cell wall biosynthesis